MPSLTAADLASRTMKKGWVNKTEQDEVDEASEDAAERTRKSVKGERRVGTASTILYAAGAAPHVAATVAKDVVSRAIDKATGRKKSPLYDKAKSDDDE